MTTGGAYATLKDKCISFDHDKRYDLWYRRLGGTWVKLYRLRLTVVDLALKWFHHILIIRKIMQEFFDWIKT